MRANVHPVPATVWTRAIIAALLLPAPASPAAPPSDGTAPAGHTRLTFTLTTHDAGGITNADVVLAREIERLAVESGI